MFKKKKRGQSPEIAQATKLLEEARSARSAADRAYNGYMTGALSAKELEKLGGAAYVSQCAYQKYITGNFTQNEIDAAMSRGGEFLKNLEQIRETGVAAAQPKKPVKPVKAVKSAWQKNLEKDNAAVERLKKAGYEVTGSPSGIVSVLKPKPRTLKNGQVVNEYEPVWRGQSYSEAVNSLLKPKVEKKASAVKVKPAKPKTRRKGEK